MIDSEYHCVFIEESAYLSPFRDSRKGCPDTVVGSDVASAGNIEFRYVLDFDFVLQFLHSLPPVEFMYAIIILYATCRSLSGIAYYLIAIALVLSVIAILLSPNLRSYRKKFLKLPCEDAGIRETAAECDIGDRFTRIIAKHGGSVGKPYPLDEFSRCFSGKCEKETMKVEPAEGCHVHEVSQSEILLEILVHEIDCLVDSPLVFFSEIFFSANLLSSVKQEPSFFKH